MTENGFHLLHLTAKVNFLGYFFELVENYGVPPDILNKEKQTALHIAIIENHFQFAFSAVSVLHDVNIQDSRGRSLLHLAVQKEKKKLVKILKIKKADPLLTDQNGTTALELSNYEIRKILVRVKKMKGKISKSWAIFYLVCAAIVLKFLIFIWISFESGKNSSVDFVFKVFGYSLSPVTLFLLVKTCKTVPRHEEKDIKVLTDLFNFYPAKEVCAICRCLKRSSSTHHCNICDICVKDYDHHCYFINNCVGRGNLKYFLVMILAIVIDSAYSVTLGLLVYQSVSNISKILDLILILLSSLILLATSPFFYLNFSNYLNATTVHQKFSKKKPKMTFSDASDYLIQEKLVTERKSRKARVMQIR